MGKKVLIVAAHPDDEAIGCGATIARHSAAGDEVRVLFLTDGVGARSGANPASVQARRSSTTEAARILGIRGFGFCDFPDNQMDSLPLLAVVRKVEGVVGEFMPQIVYTHHSADLNVDHRIAHQATLTACRPLPTSSVREILAFEVLSSTDWGLEPFVPNVFTDITEYLPQKVAALQAYGHEMRPSPHSRSVEHIEALALHRGHSCGVSRAEAFVLLRSLK